MLLPATGRLERIQAAMPIAGIADGARLLENCISGIPDFEVGSTSESGRSGRSLQAIDDQDGGLAGNCRMSDAAARRGQDRPGFWHKAGA